jgi:Domain of unknown function (DUF3576)
MARVGSTMQLRLTVGAVAVLGMLVLSGCGKSTPADNANYSDQHDQVKYHPGSVLGDDTLFSFGRGSNSQDGGGAGLGVNAYLWRGALETLSFMPLASADPFGGVIITDWYQPPTGQNERFKATAYILGRQLRADGIRVQVFRQVLQGGQWVDAPVSPTTSADIENKVLARARELRTITAGS